MKKILLASLCSFLLTGAVYAQTITNNGFENWEIDSSDLGTEIENPVGWFAGNLGLSTPDAVSKSTDAHGGSYSAKIAPTTFFGAPFPGVLFYEGASTLKPAYLNGYVKTNSGSKDTFAISLEFYDSKNDESHEVAQICTVPKSAWTPFNIAVNLPSGFSPDSFYISIVVMGNGAYGMLDDLEFGSTPLGSAFGNSVSMNVNSRPKTVSVSDRFIPNPADKAATLQFEMINPGPVEVVITDLSGKVVEKLSPQGILSGKQSIELNTEKLHQGMYFYTLYTSEGIVTRRFAVQH